jgi:meso-butanediol dehydrogenase/(S,S)-butanediol dehydrogenase/diacetyl reductase
MDNLFNFSNEENSHSVFFPGKTAILTGAASGIGLVFCRTFLIKGGNVVGCDLATSPQSVLQLQNEYPDQFVYVPCDVTDFKNVEAIFKITIDKFASIEVVLNNAGVASFLEHDFLSFKPITDQDVEAWRNVIRVNLEGVLLGTSLAMRYMSGSGVLLNVASIAGIMPSKLPDPLQNLALLA